MRLSRLLVRASVVFGLLILASFITFQVRRPVVVVTDTEFEELYGRTRSERQRKLAALRLFRRVITATVADSASPQASADTAAAAVSRPACVVFPFRYEAGAIAYAERYPDIPAVIVGDSQAAAEGQGGVLRFAVDKATDLYRAGRMAGLLCAAGGRPLLVVDELKTPQEAFRAGLAASRYSGEAVVLSPGDPLPSGGGCIVVVDADGNLPPEMQALPLVLFTWIDPSLAPAVTVALFDDSVWALLVGAVRAARGDGPVTAPSKAWFSTAAGRNPVRRIRAAANARYNAHNSL